MTPAVCTRDWPNRPKINVRFGHFPDRERTPATWRRRNVAGVDEDGMKVSAAPIHRPTSGAIFIKFGRAPATLMILSMC